MTNKYKYDATMSSEMIYLSILSDTNIYNYKYRVMNKDGTQNNL